MNEKQRGGEEWQRDNERGDGRKVEWKKRRKVANSRGRKEEMRSRREGR